MTDVRELKQELMNGLVETATKHKERLEHKHKMVTGAEMTYALAPGVEEFVAPTVNFALHFLNERFGTTLENLARGAADKVSPYVGAAELTELQKLIGLLKSGS